MFIPQHVALSIIMPRCRNGTDARWKNQVITVHGAVFTLTITLVHQIHSGLPSYALGYPRGGQMLRNICPALLHFLFHSHIHYFPYLSKGGRTLNKNHSTKAKLEQLMYHHFQFKTAVQRIANDTAL